MFDADLVASYGHMLDADCDEDCDLNCMTVVSEDSRREAYYKFHRIAERRAAQNMYLCACIELKQQTVDTEDHIIEQTVEFWLGDTIKIKVCKTFFARALGLPDARLDVLLNNETFEWYRSLAITADDDEARPTKLQLACDNTCKRLCSTEFVVNSR